MAVKIVFSGGDELRVNHKLGAVDLANVMSNSGPTRRGGFYYLESQKGVPVWVNPTSVAYLEDAPD